MAGSFPFAGTFTAAIGSRLVLVMAALMGSAAAPRATAELRRRDIGRLEPHIGRGRRNLEARRTERVDDALEPAPKQLLRRPDANVERISRLPVRPGGGRAAIGGDEIKAGLDGAIDPQPCHRMARDGFERRDARL